MFCLGKRRRDVEWDLSEGEAIGVHAHAGPYVSGARAGAGQEGGARRTPSQTARDGRAHATARPTQGPAGQEGATMRQSMLTLGLALAVTLTVASSPAFAQSSGNFTYGNTGSTHCQLQSGGNITGGQICESKCTLDTTTGTITCTGDTGSGLCMGNLKAGIKTNSGAGNVFVIRPSAVIGLLTDVTLSSRTTPVTGISSALAGVDFSVDVTTGPAPGTPVQVIPSFPVTYASRFVQISSNLFALLAAQCAADPITTATGCNFNFTESTVSAHSFDWIVPTLTSGQYAVVVNWSSSLGNTGIS